MFRLPLALAGRLAVAALAATLTLAPAARAEEHPEGLHIHDAYARSMGGVGASGAVFFLLHNHSEADDRLIAARSDVAQRVELHTHKDDGNGVMQMVEIEGGIPLPAGEMHELARGGDHVMLMGLTRELKDGDAFALTLVFESGAEVTLDVPVDNARKPAAGAMEHDHGHGHEHGTKDDGAMNHTGHEHGHGHDAAMVDTAGMPDAEAIATIMKAQFETPERPLTVEPVVVEGDHALATWQQDGKGGRALLERREGVWTIVLCGGADLRMPAFLGEHGVTGAERLSQMFNAAEDGLGADHVALASSFEGIVMISPAP
jgi:hypothetical protein